MGLESTTCRIAEISLTHMANVDFSTAGNLKNLDLINDTHGLIKLRQYNLTFLFTISNKLAVAEQTF
jgi:hypothetical protein